jgi:PBSX family phage portal protein
MSRKHKRQAMHSRAAAASEVRKTTAEAFTFGDPTPVMDRREILDYLECWENGRYYETPVNFNGLARSFRASVHHSSAIYVKRNILASTFIPHKLLSMDSFRRWALDYMIFGNGYLEESKNRLGKAMELTPPLAKYMRRGMEDHQYFYVPTSLKEHEFARGSIFHLVEYDIHQETYGLPEYLSALQSAWLNESATLFRRKYYLNGSHAGFILYLTDSQVDKTDVDALRGALRESKGPGNFRNLFMHAPGGKKDGMQILPVSEVAAKDDFFNIKNVTRDDLLAVHRVPPQLLGVMPNSTGGFGDVERAARVFAENELKPLQLRFLEVNDWLGEEVVRFTPYALGVQQEKN